MKGSGLELGLGKRCPRSLKVCTDGLEKLRHKKKKVTRVEGNRATRCCITDDSVLAAESVGELQNTQKDLGRAGTKRKMKVYATKVIVSD